eukprot:1755287-Pyramimonas_sp.AAC.1
MSRAPYLCNQPRHRYSYERIGSSRTLRARFTQMVVPRSSSRRTWYCVFITSGLAHGAAHVPPPPEPAPRRRDSGACLSEFVCRRTRPKRTIRAISGMPKGKTPPVTQA